VDDQDQVWLSSWNSDVGLVHFDPSSEAFQSFPLDQRADVRQIYGRPGEVWAAESGRDRLVVVRTR
jgi:virginiamycin B lyase